MLKVGGMVAVLLKCKKEAGQAMVEFALVFPLFLLLLCGVIDFGWFGYQQLLFDSAYQITAWDFNLKLQHSDGGSLLDTDIIAGNIYSHYGMSSPDGVVNVSGVGTFGLGEGIRQHLLQSAPGLLDDSCLYLTDANANFWIELENEVYQTGGEPIGFNIYQVKVAIDAELRYEVEPLTPLIKPFLSEGKMILHKTLVRERVERVAIERYVEIPATEGG